MTIRAHQQQWPVGQGGFATGDITFPNNRTLSYVYDCGSTSLDPLRDAIGDFTGGKEIVDLVFLSHLDSDHVNGIEALLEQCIVRLVVLPYLDSYSVLAAIGNALDKETYSHTLAQFLTSPVRWLRERGALNVLMVNRPSENGDGGEVILPNSQAEPHFLKPEEVPRENEPWQPMVQLGITGESLKTARLSDGDTVELLSAGSVIFATDDGGNDLWWLIPYAPPIDGAKKAAFENGLSGIGLTMDRLSSAAILAFVSNAEQRKKLKDCYSAISRRHNHVSMCLYSSPRCGISPHVIVSWIHGHRHERCKSFAWMHTGDAPWGVKYQIRAAAKFFEPVLPYVKILVVPHHGSEHNFCAETLAMLSPSHALISYGTRNGHGHPHGKVKGILDRGHVVWSAVTENAHSGFRTKIIC